MREFKIFTELPKKNHPTSPGNMVYEWTFHGKGGSFISWDIKKLAKIRKWVAENGHTLSWRWIRWTKWHKRHFFHLCFYSSLATETYHTGITIQWFCRLGILTQTHKYTSTNSSLSLSHCCLDFYTDHTMHCCSVPSWGDDRWLPGQINSAVSNSKNNTLTQIRAHLVSCCWVHAQAQSHCLYCPFHTRACRDTYMGSGAMQPLSHFSPCFLSLSLPLHRPWTCEILGFSFSGIQRSREVITKEAHSFSTLQGRQWR